MPKTIMKQEALRKLAEWMGWKLRMLGEKGARNERWLADTPEGGVWRISGNTFSGLPWEPFYDLNHAFELQARLTEEQLHEVAAVIGYGPIPCLRATADQRTRAICRVLCGVEVENG